jgi:hypothetical protein
MSQDKQRTCDTTSAPSRKPAEAQSAIDAFAMTVSPSAKGQKLWDEAMAQVERDRRNPRLNRARAVDL